MTNPITFYPVSFVTLHRSRFPAPPDDRLEKVRERAVENFKVSIYEGPGTDPAEFPKTHVPSYVHAAWLAGYSRAQQHTLEVLEGDEERPPRTMSDMFMTEHLCDDDPNSEKHDWELTEAAAWFNYFQCRKCGAVAKGDSGV